MGEIIEINKEFLLINEGNFIEVVPLKKCLKKEGWNSVKDAVLNMKEGKKVHVIFNASNLREVCKDQRKLIESFAKDSCISFSVYSETKEGKLLGMLLSVLSSKKIKLQVFNSRRAAIRWTVDIMATV